MKVQLTPSALGEVAVLRASGYRGAGFLIGAVIGRFTIIERLLPLDFGPGNADRVCHSIASHYQERLCGVFFCRRRPLVLEWFLNGLVMSIGGDRIGLSRCEMPRGRRQAALVPLIEDAGERWPL
jgi:hypothetical protein